MDIEKLKVVIAFIVGHKKTPNTAAAMKAFTEARVTVARKAINILSGSEKIVISLRNATSVQQFQAVPDKVQCCVSGEPLFDRVGVTLIIRETDKTQKIFCIHSRFVDACYQMFISSHFDLHVKQHFQTWCSQQPWWMPGDFSPKVMQKYITYNNNRNLKVLLIQLSQHT